MPSKIRGSNILKCLNNRCYTLVSSGDEDENSKCYDYYILEKHEHRYRFLILVSGDELDDGWEHESQRRAADCTHQRYEESELRDRFC